MTLSEPRHARLRLSGVPITKDLLIDHGGAGVRVLVFGCAVYTARACWCCVPTENGFCIDIAIRTQQNCATDA